MADSDTLAALESQHSGWVLVIEGLPYFWTDHSELAALDYCGDGREGKAGLARPSYGMGINLVDGQFEPYEVSFSILDDRQSDGGGHLAELFAVFDDSEEDLLQSFGPGTTGAAATFSKHVGTEFIGSAGERQRYPALPTQVQAGWEHLGSSSHEHPTAVPSTLSDNPVLMRGRRVALFRAHRDHTLDLSANKVFAPDLQTLEDPVSGLTGTATGARYVPSRRARYFQAANQDFVGFAQTNGNVRAAPGQPISVSCWVRFDSTQLHEAFFSIMNDGLSAFLFQRRSTPTGVLEILHNGATDKRRRGTTNLQNGRLYHVVLTDTGDDAGASIAIYVDGEEEAYSFTQDGATLNTCDDQVRLGMPTNANLVTDGLVSDVRVWNRVLTPTEVSSLYRNGWRPWSEAQRRWIGTLEDSGSVDGRRWTLRCRGIDAWVDKELGTLTQSEPVGIDASVSLDSSETQVAIALSSVNPFDPTTNARSYGVVLFGDSLGSWTGSLSTSYSSVSALASAIRTLVNEAVADTSGDAGIAFNAGSRGNELTLLDLGGPVGAFRIRTKAQAAQTGQILYKAVAEICAAERVWRLLGYDPPNQGGLPNSDPLWANFILAPQKFPQFPSDQYTGDTPDPPAGYMTLRVETLALVDDVYSIANASEHDNDGNPRLWQPRYPGGTHTLPADPGTGFTLFLGDTFGEEPWHTGQNDRPVASDPSDATQGYPLTAWDCDKQGLWLLEGPRRLAGEDEAEDEAQIARMSWHEGEYGRVDIDETNEAHNAVLTEWLDPRDYGIDRDKLQGTWATLNNAPGEHQITARPILRLSHTPDGVPSRPDVMLLRLMLSSGTSTGWSSFSNDASAALDEGDNEPTALFSYVWPLDAEIADLGLSIPREVVHDPVTFAVVYDSLPDDQGGAASYLDWQLAFVPPMTTREIFTGLFQALGWCWHFRDGKYGIFSITEIWTPDDADVTITQSEKRGSLVDIRRSRVGQELRAYSPIDHFSLEYDWNPIEESHNEKKRVRSPDKGARYRPRSSERRAGPLTIRSAAGWERRVLELAEFWQRRHFWVRRYPIKWPTPAQDIWPGTRVLLTEPDAVGQDGQYEITAYVGVVTRVQFNHDASGDTPVCTADILVQDRGDDSWTLYAPSARAVGEEDDVLFLEDNWLGLDTDGWLDVEAFERPSWYSTGNALLVEVLQWDGDSWSVTLTGTVSSIDATAGACKLTLTSTSGTYNRDNDAIVRPQDYAAQLAGSTWGADLLGPICDEDGYYTGTTLGAKWMGA